MPKDGKDLQRLIRAIESARANGRPDLKIDSPKYLRDKITGRMREHDVLLSYNLDHHQIVLALECRDRSRPVGVDAVEAFRSKCESTGIDRGIIVSSKGFAKTAVQKAAAYNIGCLNLQEVESFDWCVAPGVYVKERHITRSHMNVLFPSGIDLAGTIKTSDGRNVPEDVKAWPTNLLSNNSHDIPFEDGPHEVVFVLSEAPIFMCVEGKEPVQATQVIFTINFTVSSKLSPFRFRAYVDASNNKNISNVAVAEIPTSGGGSADVLLTSGEEGILVTLVSNSNGEPRKGADPKRGND